MEFQYFRGVAIGLAIAAPIGPVGILCIRKALADGRLAAIVAGGGAAIADTIFGAVVGLGLGAVSDFLALHQTVFRLAGGAFMAILGVKTWAAAAWAEAPAAAGGAGMVRDFVSAFAITITNPATILGVVGVFAALGAAGRPAAPADSWLLVAGVLTGSLLWWMVLASLAAAVRTSVTPTRMRVFNRLSAALLLLFAAAAVISVA